MKIVDNDEGVSIAGSSVNRFGMSSPPPAPARGMSVNPFVNLGGGVPVGGGQEQHSHHRHLRVVSAVHPDDGSQPLRKEKRAPSPFRIVLYDRWAAVDESDTQSQTRALGVSILGVTFSLEFLDLTYIIFDAYTDIAWFRTWTDGGEPKQATGEYDREVATGGNIPFSYGDIPMHRYLIEVECATANIAFEMLGYVVGSDMSWMELSSFMVASTHFCFITVVTDIIFDASKTDLILGWMEVTLSSMGLLALNGFLLVMVASVSAYAGLRDGIRKRSLRRFLVENR
ncbi:hypothetical protein MCOR23_002765 [Pyricularia oryzae]|nr:hypothetical protein MCOR23_002765 [Pyricularia oryzae]KAI6410953.1 hypothetical protein MCOR20_004472 [Pyricularia oryzae]